MERSNIYETMNPETLKDISKIEEQIQDELQKDEVDKQKLLKLREKQLMVGLSLNTGFIRANKIY